MSRSHERFAEPIGRQNTSMLTTLVVPLSSEARDGLDLRRFGKVLWPSILRHISHGLLREVIVVCRECDRYKIPHGGEGIIRTVTDEELLGRFNGHYKNGWLKQQALKLFAHAMVTTDTYLVLDADCFVVKDLHERDLFPEGKARLGIESAEGSHAEWWGASSILLRREDKKPPEGPYIGVTPQILYTRIVHDLLEELENIHQKNPREILAKNEFTEFTLYWLYLLRVAYPEDLYCMDNNRLSLSKGVWLDSLAPITDLRTLLTGGRTCFGLVQSILGIDPEYVAELLEGHCHGESKTAT